jgi:predicted nucleic-acid-binding Zn-ribbon protein
MAEAKKCPKCGSVMDRSNQIMTLPVARNSGKVTEPIFTLTGPAGAIVYPHLCHSCGFIELYSAGSISRSKSSEPTN